jgi:hypothetical protein
MTKITESQLVDLASKLKTRLAEETNAKIAAALAPAITSLEKTNPGAKDAIAQLRRQNEYLAGMIATGHGGDEYNPDQMTKWLNSNPTGNAQTLIAQAKANGTQGPGPVAPAAQAPTTVASTTSSSATQPAPTTTTDRPGLARGGDPAIYDWQKTLPGVKPDGLWGDATDKVAKAHPEIPPPKGVKRNYNPVKPTQVPPVAQAKPLDASALPGNMTYDQYLASLNRTEPTEPPNGSSTQPAPVQQAPNPYANDPKQAAIYAAMSPEDQAWATKGGGKPDLTDRLIAARAPNGFKPVANSSNVVTQESNAFGHDPILARIVELARR